jgi:hypothetical protein
MLLLTDREALQELVGFTRRTGLFEFLAIRGTANVTTFKSVDYERQAYLNGSFNEVSRALTGEFGINSLELLDGMFKLPLFNEKDSTFSIQRDAHNRHILSFRGGDGSLYGHEFLTSSYVMDVPRIADRDWIADFTSTKKQRNNLRDVAKLVTNLNNAWSKPVVSFRAEGGKVYADIDASPNPTVVIGTTEEEWDSTPIISVSAWLAIVNAVGDDAVTHICEGGYVQVRATLKHSWMDIALNAWRR